MTPKAMLISAIVSLAGLNGSLFLWAKDQFTQMEAREKICHDKYEVILRHLAGIEE